LNGSLELLCSQKIKHKKEGGVIMTPEFEKEYNAVKAEGEAIQASVSKFAALGIISGVAWSLAALVMAALCVKKLLD